MKIFNVGDVVIKPGALEMMIEAGVNPLDYLKLYVDGESTFYLTEDKIEDIEIVTAYDHTTTTFYGRGDDD